MIEYSSSLKVKSNKILIQNESERNYLSYYQYQLNPIHVSWELRTKNVQPYQIIHCDLEKTSFHSYRDNMLMLNIDIILGSNIHYCHIPLPQEEAILLVDHDNDQEGGAQGADTGDDDDGGQSQIFISARVSHSSAGHIGSGSVHDGGISKSVSRSSLIKH